MIYEMIKRFDVVPSIRRANVEAHSAWVILELSGPHDARDQAIAYLESSAAPSTAWKATSSPADVDPSRARCVTSRASPTSRT